MMMLKIDMIKLKANAHQKPSTVKPETKFSTSKIMMALITSKKRPKVITVIGMVNKMSSGLMMTLAIESTKAVHSAV